MQLICRIHAGQVEKLVLDLLGPGLVVQQACALSLLLCAKLLQRLPLLHRHAVFILQLDAIPLQLGDPAITCAALELVLCLGQQLHGAAGADLLVGGNSNVLQLLRHDPILGLRHGQLLIKQGTGEYLLGHAEEILPCVLRYRQNSARLRMSDGTGLLGTLNGTENTVVGAVLLQGNATLADRAVPRGI